LKHNLSFLDQYNGLSQDHWDRFVPVGLEALIIDRIMGVCIHHRQHDVLQGDGLAARVRHGFPRMLHWLRSYGAGGGHHAIASLRACLQRRVHH
jgi:hypothetical protein